MLESSGESAQFVDYAEDVAGKTERGGWAGARGDEAVWCGLGGAVEGGGGGYEEGGYGGEAQGYGGWCGGGGGGGWR